MDILFKEYSKSNIILIARCFLQKEKDYLVRTEGMESKDERTNERKKL